MNANLMSEHILGLESGRPGDDTRANLKWTNKPYILGRYGLTTYSIESGVEAQVVELVQQLGGVVTWAIIVRDAPCVLIRAGSNIGIAKAATASPPARAVGTAVGNQLGVRLAGAVFGLRPSRNVGGFYGVNPSSKL